MGRKVKYDARPYASGTIKWVRIGIELKDFKPVAFINKYGKQSVESNKACCSVFGCGRLLSLTEQLAGNKCTNHMDTKPINITSIIFKQ